MDNKEIVEFIKNELASISVFEFLASNYRHNIISKLMERYHLNSIEELRNSIIENGPDFNPFFSFEKKQKEKQLSNLKEELVKAYFNKSKIALKEKIDLIISEIETYPTEILISENKKRVEQINFIFEVIFSEDIKIPNNGFFITVEEKKESYSFSKLSSYLTCLTNIEFSTTKNRDIEKWREELLDIFRGKLPEIPIDKVLDGAEAALLSIKNGLLYGQAIITNDNTICLNLSDGIMIKINFYKKIITNSMSTIYYGLAYPKKSHKIYSTGGYATNVDLPRDIVFVTKKNVVDIYFEASPLLIGLTQFKPNGIVPIIERIKEEEALED